MFFTTNDSISGIEDNVDEHGDSFARDVTVEELRAVCFKCCLTIKKLMFIEIFDSMPTKAESGTGAQDFKKDLRDHDHDLGELRGWLFKGLQLYRAQLNDEKSGFVSLSEQLRPKQAYNIARFAGAVFVEDMTDESITHVIVDNNKAPRSLREQFSGFDIFRALLSMAANWKPSRKRLPRFVTLDWIEQSWAEKTLLDEERKASLPQKIRAVSLIH